MTGSRQNGMFSLVTVPNGPTLKFMLAALFALLLIFGFIHLASEVGEGETGRFDQSILEAAQSLRASYIWLADVMRDLSGLGSTVVLSLISVSTVTYMAMFRRRQTALLLACAIVSGTLLVSLFKMVFARERPPANFADFIALGWSFPSGHASMSALVYLTLGAFIASRQILSAERKFILLVAAIFTALVGVSRVVLGVHFATDVLGGWIFGTSWAIVWLLIASWLAADSHLK